jgi:hypothetical protein
MWFFTVCTLAVLLVIGDMLLRLDKLPGTARLSAATSPAAASSGAQLTDHSTGLSYDLLRSPWRTGCPVRTSEFGWTDGEGAVAGTAGHAVTWYGNACSGPLAARFRAGASASEGAGGSGLERSAYQLADAVERAYYGAARHGPFTVTRSAAMRVSGHPAWLVEFDLKYEGLAWRSELGAVVVVDSSRGPAAFYVSVPSSLGTANVSLLLSSLRSA